MLFALAPGLVILIPCPWLFTPGKVVIGFSQGRTTIGSAYRAAGSLVVVLLRVYYCSQIVFFGAEFIKVWTRRRGAGAVPTEAAVPLIEEARAEQGMLPHREPGPGRRTAG